MEGGKSIVIGVDQGTTNTKAVAVDRAGKVLAQASRPIASAAPQLGWVEQDPRAMLENVVTCVREVLGATGNSAGAIAGIGIANQTETLVIWDRRSGEPVLPAIVWKCRRGAEEIAPLQNEQATALILDRTGLSLDPTFTAPKLKWVFTHRPAVAEGLSKGDYLFGTVDCWLIWSLTGGAVYATDASNASRTMLLDIDSVAWEPKLAELFGLGLARWPEVRRSAGSFGETATVFFDGAIPITAAVGDQQASLFGHGCFECAQMKVTYGTGAFLWVNAGGNRPFAIAGDGLLRTIAWKLDRPTYAVEGFVMYAGAILDWLASRLAVVGGGPAVARQAEQAGTSDGVVLVPAFQGLAAPWWNPEVRAGLLGMTEATTSGNLCHAALEALCYQIRALLGAVERATGREIETIKVDGGPTRSDYLMQLQADILQRPLAISAFDSMTPYGAALMAGLGAGLWSRLGELERLVTPARTVRPDPTTACHWEKGYKDWFAAAEALLAYYGGRHRSS
ncbi:MAG: FGGY-family carbohydrate kinase [Pseudomonadota bacterium]